MDGWTNGRTDGRMDWLVFCLATRLTCTRDWKRAQGKTQDGNMPLLLTMPEKPSKLSINFVSQTVSANFNLSCEGQRGHNTGRKGHFRDERDKTKSLRTKGDNRNNWGLLFLFRRFSHAWNHARCCRASFQISIHETPFVWIMNILRYEWQICFRCYVFIYISRRLECFLTLLKTLCWFSSWPNLSK